MKGNLDDPERIIRISSGFFMALFGLLLGTWWEVLGMILGALGLILVFLGIVGWSPTYAILEKKPKQQTTDSGEDTAINKQDG